MKRFFAGLMALCLCIAWLTPVKAAAAQNNPLVLQKEMEKKKGKEIRYYYDKNGNLVRKEWENKGDYVEEYFYNAAGVKIRERTYKDGKIQYQTSYDSKGNETIYWSADKNGKLVKRTEYSTRYDEYGRVLTIESKGVNDPLNSRSFIRYEYRDMPDSSREEVTDAVARYHHNYSQTDPDTGETYTVVSMMQTYDDEGRMIEDRDAVEGRRISWDYDDQGNVTQKMTTLEAYEYASLEISDYDNIYNRKGQLVEVRIHTTVQMDLYGNCETQEYDDVIKYKYDSRGRKISEESYYDSGLASTEIWRYDSQDRMTYREYHSGTWDITQTWTYDRYGNLLKTTRNGNVEKEYLYVPLNQALWKK